MIFYFSGTGNSRYVAEKIAHATEEKLVNMTQSEIDKNSEYMLQNGENLGFVFPIYWWGMPALMEEFIQKMEIRGNGSNYIYGVCTYGLGAHNGLKDLERLLVKKKLYLQATYEVKMVDNYVVAYDIAGEEQQEKIYEQAKIEIEKIIRNVTEHKQIRVSDRIGTTIKPIVHSFYKHTDHRKKFYVTDSCTGCGSCAAGCPCQAISMEEHKPVWKENCAFCLKCIHSCPVQAVQYGKGTLKRSRYLNHMDNLEYIWTDGSNPDFARFSQDMEEYYNQMAGGEQNRKGFIPYNALKDIHDVVIVYNGNHAVACASFKEYSEEDVEIKRVWVDPNYRGHHISKKMIEMLEKRAKERGYRRAILQTREKCVEAVHLYKTMGYEQMENYPPYDRMNLAVCYGKNL